jgi:phage terminase small subunit
MRKLTSKQQRFVEEYVAEPNAAQAARRAGYSDLRSAMDGWRNLQNPRIKAAIEQAKEKEVATS